METTELTSNNIPSLLEKKERMKAKLSDNSVNTDGNIDNETTMIEVWSKVMNNWDISRPSTTEPAKILVYSHGVPRM